MGVVLNRDGEGNFAIGAEIEGVFVPFAVVTAQRVKHLVERGETLAERASDEAHEGHVEAQKVLAEGFQPVAPATAPETGELEGLSKAELLALAESRGVEGVSDSKTKAEIIAAIREYEDEGGGE